MAVALAASYYATSTSTITLPANSSATWHTTSSTTTSTFSGALNDVIVIKAATGQPTTTVTSVSNGYTGTGTKGVVDAFTRVAYETAASGVAPIWIYIGKVTTAGAFNISVGVTTTASSAQVGNFFVERYTGVVVPTTWNVGLYPTPKTASPYTQSFTTQSTGAVVSWMAADWNGKVTTTLFDSADYGLQSGAVFTRYFCNSTAGGLDGYGAYQTVATPGTTTIGYTDTAVTGQSVTFAAVELPSVAVAVPRTSQFMPFF